MGLCDTPLLPDLALETQADGSKRKKGRSQRGTAATCEADPLGLAGSSLGAAWIALPAERRRESPGQYVVFRNYGERDLPVLTSPDI